MTVRQRTDADLPACVDALAAVHEATGYPSRWPADPQRWLRPANLAAAWIAEADGAVVGHVGLTHGTDQSLLVAATGKPSDELGAIVRLFVHPAARRNGHARALLQAAVEHCRTQGWQPVLDVVESAAPAVALYEREGWHHVGTAPSSWVDASGRHEIVRYYLAP